MSKTALSLISGSKSLRPFVLASQSPRRKELLKRAGFDFSVHSFDCDEETDIIDPVEFVIELSKRKSEAASEIVKMGIVLTADTIVHIDGHFLGKPKDREDAGSMIRQLSGNTHQVYTGLCLRALPEDRILCGYERTDVTFTLITEDEIEWYFENADYMDKAGGYAIQEHAARFIRSINGCYFNVVGLPLHKLYSMLKEFHIN